MIRRFVHRFPWLAVTGPLLAISLSTAPRRLAAQELAPGPQVHERIERLRQERLREALRLDEEQSEALRQSLETSQREAREAMARHQRAIAALRQELQRDPVDQEAVRRSLAAVEAQREALSRLRQSHDERLSRILNPEQRAKLLLFNRQFDQRLRELIAQRQGLRSPGRPGLRTPGRPGLNPPARPTNPPARPTAPPARPAPPPRGQR